jgi:glutaredoxin
MTSLLARLVRRTPKGPAIPVTVYTRKDCGCCHKAITLLSTYRRKHNLRIEEVDIDTDPELVASYGLTVPVVAIDGKVRFKGVVNPVLLDRLLAAR